MKPFDPTNRCDKCSTTGGASMNFHKADDGSCPDRDPLPHLHYTCNTCKFVWMTVSSDGA